MTEDDLCGYAFSWGGLQAAEWVQPLQATSSPAGSHHVDSGEDGVPCGCYLQARVPSGNVQRKADLRHGATLAGGRIENPFLIPA